MKQIAYELPVDYMRGNISGKQEIKYNGAHAYDVNTGTAVTADNYQPRIIAQVKNMGTPNTIRMFQVRTKTTINMTNAMRMNMATMGGSGALYASLLNNKSAPIYAQCIAAKPVGLTLRQFIIPIIRAGLTAKDEKISITGNVYIVNPWISSEAQNVPVSNEILSKFEGVLSL